MIVYASLEPFSAWMAPIPGTPFFLFAPWPPRYTRFDVAINCFAYAPFGLALALIGDRVAHAASVRAGRRRRRAAVALHGKRADVLANARRQCDRPALEYGRRRARRARRSRLQSASPDCAMASAPGASRVFLEGRGGDLGLALLGIWLLAQVNPGIPLFAATFDPSLELTSDLAGHPVAGGAKRVQRRRRRPVPGVARPPAPISRLGGAAADRFRAGAQGQRREPAAAAGGARNMAQAGRIRSASSSAPSHCLSPSGCRDRCARRCARSRCCRRWSRRCLPPTCGRRAHRSPCSTGPTGSCSTSIG